MAQQQWILSHEWATKRNHHSHSTPDARTHVHTHIWWADSWQVTLSIDPEHRRVHTRTHTQTHAHSHSQMNDHCGKNCTKCQAWKPGGQKCISSPCSPGQAIERCASPADNEEYLWGTRPSLVTSSYNSDAGMPRKKCWAQKRQTEALLNLRCPQNAIC